MHSTPKRIFIELIQERPLCERQALLHDHECRGRSTMEHVWRYAGRQIDEKWAIIRLCEWAHSVGPYLDRGILDKRINEWISLRHATLDDLEKYPAKDWEQRRKFLNKKYGN